MPILEVILFASALAIGGPRAWEKFQRERAGIEETDSKGGCQAESRKLPPTLPPKNHSSPSSPRPRAAVEGTAVNWRSQGASPRVPAPTASTGVSPSRGEFGSMLQSALALLSPRGSNAQGAEDRDIQETSDNEGCAPLPALHLISDRPALPPDPAAP